MTFTASARPVGDSLRQQVLVNSRHTIITDEPVEIGGTDAGPTPHQLLAAALASCITATVSLYGRRKGLSLDGLSVDVTYDNESEPRRFTVVLSLPDTLTPEQIERVRRVAAACPVHRSMEAGFAFDERLESEAEARPGQGSPAR
jgi:putative redox protein